MTAGGRSAPPAAVDGLLRPFVPRLAARWMASTPGDTVRTVPGSLVSADVSGFTALSERLAVLGRRGAEELTDLLNECFDAMIATCTGLGGDVVKFGGDALLVQFVGPGHELRAARAAAGMRADIARPLRTSQGDPVRLRMSAGVHSGEFFYVLPRGEQRELLVVGPDVTETLDCEALAPAGGILLSRTSALAVPAGVLGDELGPGRLLRRMPVAPEVPGPDELPPEVTDELLAPLVPAGQRARFEAAALGEHRRAAAAFIRFSGVDELLEDHGPEEVAARLELLAHAVDRITDRHGVHWLSSDAYHDGGKLLLTAGVPTSGVDDEDHLVRAVRAVLDEDCGLVLRGGVGRGLVFAGPLGSARRQAFTVMGDEVNLAARLMQRAGPGELLVTSDVLDRCRSGVGAVPVPPFTVKGKARPVGAALVTGMVAAPVDEDDDTVEHGLPLVGRRHQRQLLVEALSAAQDGRGGGVELIGPAGIGKSRLVAELRREARATGTSALTATCQPYLASVPYGALRGVLRRAVGIAPGLSRADAGRLLAAVVHEQAPQAARWLPLLAIVLGTDADPTTESDELAPSFRRRRMHEALVELLAAVAQVPLLLVVEDSHWLDDASRDLLARVLDSAGERPWLVCLTSWTPASAGAGATPVTLDPLPADDAVELVRAAPTGAGLEPDVVHSIAERSGGNPLFVLELVAAGQGGSLDDIPDTVEALVTARVDELPPAERALLQESTVLGMQIDLGLLAAVLGDAAADESRWRAMEGMVFRVRPGTYRFGHDLLRQAVYEGLSYRRRRELHARVGRAMEAAQDPVEQAPMLALHFHLGEDHERAWRYGVLAGDQARDAHAPASAAEYYEQALGHAPHIGGLRAEVRAGVAEALGDVGLVAGQFERAESGFAAARALAGISPVDTARLLRKSGEVLQRRSRYSVALRLYTRARNMLTDAGVRVDRELAELAVTYSHVRYRQGRYRDCFRWAVQAQTEAEAAAAGHVHGRALQVLHLVSIHLGDDREEYGTQALALFEDVGDLVGQGNVLSNLGMGAYFRAHWRDALDYYRRSGEVRRRAGDVVGTEIAGNNIAEILLDQGRLDEARPLLESARSVWARADYPVGVALATLNLGRLAVRAGEVEAGLELHREATSLCTSIGAASMASECRVRMLEALLDEGKVPAVEEVEALAVELARLGGDEHLQVALRRVLGLAWAAAGNAAEARRALDDAVHRAEAGGRAYELALSLAVRARVAGAAADPAAAVDARRANRLFERLEVVRLPTWAVPPAPGAAEPPVPTEILPFAAPDSADSPEGVG